MKIEELADFGEVPILLKDGEIGLVVRWDTGDSANSSIGIQVSGEDEFRWLPARSVENLGNGALIQRL